jgi:glycerate 2-kinase
MTDTPLDLMRAAFDSAVHAVAAEECVRTHLPAPPQGRTLVIGAGKAAAAMALEVEAHWPADAPLDGLVITRYGHGAPTTHIQVVEAEHPLPDASGEEAARRIRDIASSAGPDDLVLCLLSGGGSSLMAMPAPGLNRDHKRAVTRSLMRAGATIAEINCVRKHLSAIKGGHLAEAAAPACLVTLMISDVTQDDPSVIASGPTVPDPTTVEDAQTILTKYQVDLPAPVAAHLITKEAETPKPSDVIFAKTTAVVIANADDALAAAADVVQQAGFQPQILGGHLEGDAATIARHHAALITEARRTEAPTAILSGGELTVTLSGEGRGGPNQEYLLALALALGPEDGTFALACDTDGIDGSEDNAGAWITPNTLLRAHQKGLDAAALLRDNNSYEFFRQLGDIVMTGPTRTNVNDFRVILVNGE